MATVFVFISLVLGYAAVLFGVLYSSPSIHTTEVTPGLPPPQPDEGTPYNRK